MKSIFKSTAILSSGSLITVFLSLISAKVLAVYLGPFGYGYYGLLQSFVAFVSLISGMSIATGIVRFGAGPITRSENDNIAKLRSGAWFLFAVISCMTVLMLASLRTPISRWAFGTPKYSSVVVWMSLALIFTVASNIQSGILNAYHRVKVLASIGVANTIITSSTTIVSVYLWGERGLAPALIIGPGISCIVTAFAVRRSIGAPPAPSNWPGRIQSAWELLRFGGPYTGSILVGGGVQIALPMLAVHLLSAESVGYYKAATAISVGYLGFLVTAMGQDYYPRLSAVADQPVALVTLVNKQHRLVMLLAVPIIISTLALVPLFIPIIYSRQFAPAADILEWQLIGDLFKFSSWTMSFVMLARSRVWILVLAEAINGTTNLGGTWLAVRWLGLPGLGIGFLASYIVYYFVVWVIMRREIQLTWTRANKRMMIAAVTASVLMHLSSTTHLAAWRSLIAFAIAFGSVSFSSFMIWNEFRSDKQWAGMPHGQLSQSPQA